MNEICIKNRQERQLLEKKPNKTVISLVLVLAILIIAIPIQTMWYILNNKPQYPQWASDSDRIEYKFN